MQHDPLADLKKHYRSTWLGTIAGFLFVGLLVLFVVELHFSERYLGPRTIRWLAFNLAVGGGFLLFLILYNRQQARWLDRIRYPLMAGAVGYFFWFWVLAFTNRVGRGDLLYDYRVFVEEIILRSAKIEGSDEVAPSHWEIRVRDEANRLATFDGPLDRFTDDLRGKQLTLSAVQGRWGQDYIALFE